MERRAARRRQLRLHRIHPQGRQVQNLDSFGTRKLTGRFVIDNDAELGAVIRGSYDYGAGDWAHRYIVTDFTETSMVWTAKDDRSDVQVFVRCDGIPDEVTGGKTEE